MEAARRLLQEAVQLARAIGARRHLGVCLGSLALAGAHADRAAERRALEEALAVARELGDERYEGFWSGNLGSMGVADGELDDARPLLERAAASALARGDRRSLAIWSTELARLERRAGDLAAAAAHLDAAERCLGEVRDETRLAIARCERGHLALALGRDAVPYLDDAGSAAARLAVAETSQLAQSVETLRRAVVRASAGGRLVLGECVEDLPPPLRPEGA